MRAINSSHCAMELHYNFENCLQSMAYSSFRSSASGSGVGHKCDLCSIVCFLRANLTLAILHSAVFVVAIDSCSIRGGAIRAAPFLHYPIAPFAVGVWEVLTLFCVCHPGLPTMKSRYFCV